MNYEEASEAIVSHIVRMAQVDADYARHAAKAYANMKDSPCPDLIADVKRHLDELGIELPPKQPTPWYLKVDSRGYRIKPHNHERNHPH